jgi:hypothetical protein
VQVSVAWLKDHPEVYRALYKLWASEEFIAKFMRARECRGTDGPPGHTYGPDGHVRTGQQMLKKIVTKNTFTLYFFLTNSYPQERASGQRPPEMKVWKKGHKGSGPSNPDKLCNPVVEARLVSYWQTFVTFSLLSVLSHLQFACLCRKSIRKKWSKTWWMLQLWGHDHWRSGRLWQRRRKSTWTVRSMQYFL